ncbi:hypothetical protein [Streptacidiphilus rugosus]|uniref:hypothetical protein n=1 Tax=Streptacidiphilus rugosus TaxID=405783 RepID=UPI00056AA3C5|nr:hypothetical protein [Streptacidiphilus rugosus]
MVDLKAEYGAESGIRWHVVPDADRWALCHQLLSSIAATRPITDMTDGAIGAEQLCEICRTSFEGSTGAASSAGSPL